MKLRKCGPLHSSIAPHTSSGEIIQSRVPDFSEPDATYLISLSTGISSATQYRYYAAIREYLEVNSQGKHNRDVATQANRETT